MAARSMLAVRIAVCIALMACAIGPAIAQNVWFQGFDPFLGPEFGTIDPYTGATTYLSVPPDQIGGLAFGPGAILYATGFSTPTEVYRVDALSGAFAGLGATSQNIGALANDANGTIYTLQAFGTFTSTLSTLDPSTLALTSIGPVHPYAFRTPIAYLAGELYAFPYLSGTNTSAFEKIDPATGIATSLSADLGIDITAAVGADEKLFGFAPAGEIVTLDTNTGVATANGAHYFPFAINAAAATPEPGMVALATGALFGALPLARRRRRALKNPGRTA